MWRKKNKQLVKLPSWALAIGLAFGLGAYASAITRDAASIPKTTSKVTLPLLTYKNWGIDSPEGNSNIRALDAWKLEEGSRDVVVAVIDTGVDITHPDLAMNIWRDKTSKTPLYGWDFVRNAPNPIDEHGHGTHVAGIIGAAADVRTGVSGVAHRVSIMPIRYYSESNPGAVNLANTIKGIEWAVDHGAKIINYSGGGPEFSEAEYLALRKAELKGVLIVAAAGNERQNTDKIEHYYYPAAYRLSNIISVAATDRSNNLIPSSNWGKTRVDVAAPGDAIFSTLPNRRYGQMSGTSQATAFVTGIAALLLSKDPSLKPQQVRQIILNSVDKFPQLRDKLASGGRVNAYTSILAVAKPKPHGQPVIKFAQRELLDTPIRVPAERSLTPSAKF